MKGFKKVELVKYTKKSDKIEIIGVMEDNPSYEDKNVIMTVQVHPYKPHSEYGEPGKSYKEVRRKKVKDPKSKEWTYKDEEVTKYEMSRADKEFIYDSYVHYHLTAEQISILSDIPQPYIFRYIKHYKLKPQYEKTPRSKNKIDIDFDEPFHLDPFPSRSEWKARRETLGLKNGENWRNTSTDQNPGERQYGDGKTASKKNLAKLDRKEGKKRRNIQKFNKNQNNTYGISNQNPEGTKDPYKKRRESLRKKANKDKGELNYDI
jgi:hypothetical protein